MQYADRHVSTAKEDIGDIEVYGHIGDAPAR